MVKSSRFFGTNGISTAQDHNCIGFLQRVRAKQEISEDRQDPGMGQIQTRRKQNKKDYLSQTAATASHQVRIFFCKSSTIRSSSRMRFCISGSLGKITLALRHNVLSIAGYPEIIWPSSTE